LLEHVWAAAYRCGLGGDPEQRCPYSNWLSLPAKMRSTSRTISDAIPSTISLLKRCKASGPLFHVRARTLTKAFRARTWGTRKKVPTIGGMDRCRSSRRGQFRRRAQRPCSGFSSWTVGRRKARYNLGRRAGTPQPQHGALGFRQRIRRSPLDTQTPQGVLAHEAQTTCSICPISGLQKRAFNRFRGSFPFHAF